MAYGAILGQQPDLSPYANSVQLQSTSVNYGDLPVGSTVSLNVGGVPYDWIVVQQGTPSSMYDSSCNGTWLMMKDCYNQQVWDAGNVNDYGASDINTYLNGTFYNLLDSSVQSIVQQVKIPYVNGTGSGGSVASGANGLSCKVFLLGAAELGWSGSSFPIDGATLSYFQNISIGDAKYIAYLNNNAINWWLRSPNTTSNTLTWLSATSGSYVSSNCTSTYGVRPVIVLSNTPLTTYTLTLPDGTDVVSEVSEALGLPDGGFGEFAKIETGSYVGTGRQNIHIVANQVLTKSILFIYNTQGGNVGIGGINPGTSSRIFFSVDNLDGNSGSITPHTISISNKSISLTPPSGYSTGLNDSGVTYNYQIIGI